MAFLSDYSLTGVSQCARGFPLNHPLLGGTSTPTCVTLLLYPYQFHGCVLPACLFTDVSGLKGPTERTWEGRG